MRVSIDDSILTDIADAIRDKKESTDTYAPQEMAGEISSIAGIIPTGTINITANNTYDVTQYASASVNVPSDPSEFIAGELTTGTSTVSSLYKLIKKLPSNLTVSGTSLQNSCRNCIGLIEAELIDTTGVENMNGMFNGCSNLEKVPVFNTSSITNFNYMFGNCPKLTDESLENILTMCINATSYSGNKTLSELGLVTNLSIYTSARIQGLSNYQDFINAGWTIGY